MTRVQNVQQQFRERLTRPPRYFGRLGAIRRRAVYLQAEWLVRDVASLAREPTTDELQEQERRGQAIGATWAARKRGIM